MLRDLMTLLAPYKVEREQLLSETYILINKNIPLPSMRIPKSKVESLFEEMALSGDVVKSRECIYLRKAVLWPALFGLHDCAGLLRPSRRCPPAVPTWPAGG